MRFHLIIDHPNTHSFNHAVMKSFAGGLNSHHHVADILDLNEDGFDPIMTLDELRLYPEGGALDLKVREYQQRLLNTNYLALFFPIWWNVMPARMKGWLDRVLLPGFAFTTGQFPEPLLTHIQGATVFSTTGVSDEFHRREYHNALEWVLCKGVLEFVGIKNTRWLNFGETGFASQNCHDAWLAYVRDYAAQL
jgi:putative NADPH-quinone reductase